MKHLKSTTACAITLGMLAGAPMIQAAEQTGMESGKTTSGAALDLTTSYRSDKVIGMTVKNTTGEDLGEISQIILDNNGQATHVVLSAGGVLGMAEEEYVVPWNQVQLSQGRDHAVIDVQKNAISSEFSAFELDEGSAPMMRKEESGGTGMQR